MRTRPARGARADASRARWPDLLLVAAAFALALAVRLRGLGESCLWFDELFGLHAARHEWGGLLRFVALDLVHPPLFYVLLKVWTALGGESVWWLRLLPALLSSLAVVPVALLGRELRLPARAVGLALVLAAASGLLVKYAQEVRMYAPLLLLAACSLWLFARFCREGDEDAAGRAGDGAAGASPRRSRFAGPFARKRLAALVALTCANLLLVYTHYFGWLLVGLELAFAATWARGRFKPLAASALLLAACFAPWAWEVAHTSAAEKLGGGLEQNIGWAARPGARELPLPYLMLHEPFRFQRHSAESPVLRLTVVLTLALFAPALAALAFRELRRRRGHARARAPEVEGREGDGARGESARRADAAARANREERAGPDGEAHTDPDEEERADSSGVNPSGVNPSGLNSSGLETFALRFLVFFSTAPVVAAFLLSQVLPQSVWGTRHLVVVAPAYLLLAAHAVASLRPRWLSAGAQLLLGCWLLLAAAGWLARRDAPLVWCSWETLASQLARAEGGGGRSVNVYATEELAAYHLWHALDGGARGGGAHDGGARFRVAVVKNVPGATEDRAFFLPRGFDGVATVDAAEAMSDDDFWIALRAPAADADHALLRALAARGYETGPRFEATAQGQRVTLARARRR